jgi:ABC-type lipoprotein release transport system permease subunit
MRNIKDSEKYT